MTLPVGSRLGAYVVQGELGRGGMGHVYLAEHVSMGRKAALKLLAPELAGDEAFRERFVRESQLIAAIEHPNMIPIYDAGEVDGVLFIAMRYVDGYDLNELIKREGPLEAERALEIVGQAAAALDAAHAREIVHRDVKPGNILIDKLTGRAFLTDFGVAKRARTQATQAGLFVGTADYASPEQIQGQETGPPTDVYALGCVLYESFTGEPPYPKDTDVAVMYGHLLDTPPLVTAKRPDLAPGLDGVVATALAKEAGNRFGSCGELVAAASLALRGGTVVRAPPRAEPLAAAHVTHRRRGALPSPATALIGRERELKEAVEALRQDAVRLVTLTGPGGTGKTRLALDVASALAVDFPDGVCFVGLANVNDPALVLPAVAAALNLEETAPDARDPAAGDTVLEALRLQLGNERLLLLLDNFEHLLPAAPLVADLIGAVAGLKVLATSRAVLRLRGEQEHPVAPFDLPDPDAAGSDAIGASPAVRLFVDRALDARPGFVLTAENAPAVAEICRRLDGLPLAIELAAARMKLLTPQAVAARLENRLQLLTGGARDLPSRHQTLRGTIDWSYDLLDSSAQTLLARLGVFVGGFSLEAAELVCGSEELPPDLIVDALSFLAAESLVRRRDDADGEVRFELLETIKEYALFRLIERRELDELRRRHAAYCVDLAETAEPELVGSDQALWLRRLDAEAGNIRTALAWSLDAELESGLRIAGALSRYWSMRGQLGEGRSWLKQALQRDAEVPPQVRGKAVFAAGYGALGQGDYPEAIERFEESLRFHRELADAPGTAMCLAQVGWLLAARGDLDRGALLSEESLELARGLGELRTASLALSNLGDVAFARGDHAGAATLYAESLGLRREIGDSRIVADALLKLGRVEALRGEPEAAAAMLREGLELARGLEDGWTISVALASLAFAGLTSGATEGADALLTEALGWARKRGDKRLAAECLGGLASLAAHGGQPARAARLWGAAAGLREAIGAPVSPLEQALLDAHEAGVRASLGGERYDKELTAGRRLEFESAVDAATRS
jgi:predicted ATPase/predicted Ser/Thr protein kinase